MFGHCEQGTLVLLLYRWNPPRICFSWNGFSMVHDPRHSCRIGAGVKIRPRAERPRQATQGNAFSRMTVEDIRTAIPAQFYPSWVVFSEQQRLNWLNLELNKIWPFLNVAASELLRSSFEQILEQYISGAIASLKFSKLTLGTVAPEFTGVSIVESDNTCVTVELEMQWNGNQNIILDVDTVLGVTLPIQVKNIVFVGIVRIIFKPLVDVLPCFGAISYSLREKKKLDYKLKIVGGELSSITGISDAIEDTIHDSIEDSITWPVRIIYPVIPGDYSDLELKSVGTLNVKLVRARNLSNKDLVGKSDPLAKLYIRPLREKIKRSKTINNDLNPIWNEHFEFAVEDPSTQHLTIKIYDDEGVQSSKYMGGARVSLRDLLPGKVKDVWLGLVKDLEIQRDKKDRGQVHLELFYCPFGMENEIINPFSIEKTLKSEGEDSEVPVPSTSWEKGVILRGVLSVTVISAEDLPGMDLKGKTDPYVVLTMSKTGLRNKTRVVKKSLNPTWNETFDFVVEDAPHDLLMLEVYDHNTFGKEQVGECIMTLTRVLIEGEYSESVPLENAESGKLNLHLKWTPQPLYRDP